MSDINELLKSMLRFSWALPLFSAEQLANLLKELDPNQPTSKATEAFNSVTEATEAQLGDALKATFKTGEQLQGSVVDLLTSFLPSGASSPSQVSGLSNVAPPPSTTPFQAPGPVSVTRTPVARPPQVATPGLDLGYTNASFQGQYGFSIIFGPCAAVGIGIAISDGKGNFHGIQKLNTEGQHIPFTYEGTYQVSKDGTGTAHVSLKAPDGTVTEADFDYVVLHSVDIGSFKLGTEWQGLTREPTNGIYGVSWFKSIP